MREERGFMLPTVQFGADDVFVIEDWDSVPIGPYRALFHYSAGGHRTLFASTEKALDFVPHIHRFDEKHLAKIESKRDTNSWLMAVDAGDAGKFEIELRYQENLILKAANLLLPFLPKFIALNPFYLKTIPRVAGPMLGMGPDLKTFGRTEVGTMVYMMLEKIYMVTEGKCVMDGKDLGGVTDCTFHHDLGELVLLPKPVFSRLRLYYE